MKTFFSGFHHLQAFFCLGQIFCSFFSAAQFVFNFVCLWEETKTFWYPEGGYKIYFCPEGWAFLSRGRIFVLRAGPFWVFPVNEKRSLSEPEKLKMGRPEGQKFSQGTKKLNLRDKNKSCTLPRDTKMFLFPLKDKQNWKQIEQLKKRSKKFIGQGKNMPVNDENRREVFSSGYFCFRQLLLVLNCEKVENRVLF